MNSIDPKLPVVVIGAGPVGLAAAAHLAERGLEPLVLESGSEVGSAIREWGHVRLFSPWKYDIDAAARRALQRTAWVEPAGGELPTGAELIDHYLAPLAETEALQGWIRTSTRVIGVSRRGIDKTRTIDRDHRPLIVRVINNGRVEDIEARAVIDASGTWGHSNPLGGAGLPAPGERESDTAGFLAGPLPDVLGVDRSRFAGRHVLVAGKGHSAANSLLSLVELAEAEPETKITWLIRGGSAARLYGGGDSDELPARGALGTRLKEAVRAGKINLIRGATITSLTPTGDRVEVEADTESGLRSWLVDVIINATGFRPDLDLLRELRLDLDPATEAPSKLAPMIDPNFHSCGSVPPHGESVLSHPESGFYIVGMKSYGRAPTFLLATGYEQVRSIAASIAGDHEAAEQVQLVLPETGVCSANPPAADEEVEGAACCGSQPEVSAPIKIGFRTGVEHGLAGELDRVAEGSSRRG